MKIIFILAAGFIMAMLDVTAVNIALPDIGAHLGVGLTVLIWVVDAYTLTFASLLLFGGAMADRFGARRVYQSGLGIFVLGSLLCGIASDGQWLIGARLLQGVGAAMFMPSSLSLLTHEFEDSDVRTSMLGIWSALVGGAAAVGPLAGGALIHFFGWRSVFWINLPLGLLGAILTQVFIKPSSGYRIEFSARSHALGVLIVASMSFVLIEGPSRGWTSGSIVLPAGAMLGMLFLLIRRELSGAHPVVPRQLVQEPSFVALNMAGFLNNFGLFGQLFLLGFYFQQGHAASALRAGVLLLPTMVAVTCGNVLSSRLSRRFGLRNTMIAGWSMGTLAAAILAIVGGQASYVCVVSLAALLMLATGSAIPAMTTAMMQVAGKQFSNSAAAALNANRQVGALVGVAAIGTIFHVEPAWSARISLSFASFGILYALSVLFIHRHVTLTRHGGRAEASLVERCLSDQ
jgi:DHA2 family methylenomycin A resistance protein-like MFS transporter